MATYTGKYFPGNFGDSGKFGAYASRSNRVTKHTGKKWPRARRGQALIEGAVGMIMLCMVGVPLLILLLNIGQYMTWSVKLNYIAGEAARYIDANRYWLGMERRDYNREKAIASAVNIANGMLKSSGLPQISNSPDQFEINDLDVEIYPPGSDKPHAIHVTQVNIVPPGLTLGLNSCLPTGLRVKGSGISTDAPNSISPPMIVTVCGEVKDLNNNPRGGNCNLELPCFGAGTTSGGSKDGNGFFTPQDIIDVTGGVQAGSHTPGYKFVGAGFTYVTPVTNKDNNGWAQ